MADPLWINADSGAPAYSADELRRAMALPLQFGGRLLGGRQGVRPGGNQLKVSLAGTTITVQPGLAVVDPGLATTQGPYWVAIPTAETHTLAPADATNPRKDIVILRVYDHDMDSSGRREAVTEYLVGTPSPTPAEPAVPAGALRLATIDVPQVGGGSPVVTDRRQYCFTGPATVVYTSSGTFKPADYPWARTWRVRVVGGGGGGGGCGATAAGQNSEGGGGGGGGYAERWGSIAELPDSVTVTVGAGGSAGVGANGGNGGTSSFGSFCSATGGSGGASGTAVSTSTTATSGMGGQGQGGDITTEGDSGGNGRVINGEAVCANHGGGTVLAGIQRASIFSTDGLAGNFPGGGGSGARNAASASARPGGAGAPGVVIVELY